MLIGRAAEFAELTGALDDAAAGRARVVLVGGDAGVGKTHLVSALESAARERDRTVLVGQCAELGESVPYLPLADALWAASRDGGPAAGAVRDALAARPVLERLLPDGDGGRAEPLAPDLGRQRLFGAALGLLGELGGDRPVLLVLEDLHWADRSTRDLLTFLSRVLQRERVCLVGTYRSDDLHRRHPLRPLVAELRRLPNVTGVQVRPFGRGETAAYLAALSGTPAAPVPADVVERVHLRSEGNPFYAAELHAAGDLEELPAGLADLLLSRVERLSPDARRVVRVAAVAGRRVDDELVRRVSGLAEDAAGEALREVVSHQLLVPGGAGYSFRHALLREAVYADLLPGERTRLHAGFARLLAGDPDERTDGRPDGHTGGWANGRRGSAAELAHHSLAAHDLPAAFAASVRAGREADRVGAPAEAFEHHERALELWDAVPDPEAAAGTGRERLALAAARAAAEAGELRRAVHRLRRLLETADPADAPLGVEIRQQLSTCLGELDEDTESQAVARAAVAMLPPDPPTPERARALATYAKTLLWHDPAKEMPALAEDAAAAARAAGAADAEASLLVTLGYYHESLTGEGAAELLARARDLAVDSGSSLVTMRAMFHYTRVRFDRGDLEDAARAAADGVRYATGGGLGHSTYGTLLRCLQYLIRYTAGDWAEAARLADGFGVQVVRRPEGQVSAYALFLEVARGDALVDERLRWLEPLLPGDPLLTYIVGGLAAEHALWRGDAGAALEHVDRVMDSPYAADLGVLRIAATGLQALAERARATGDDLSAAADGLADRARAAAAIDGDGRPRAFVGVEGHGWLARVEAERRRVDGVLDPDLWRRAADLFRYGTDGAGFVYEVARSRWRLAEALAEAGDRDGAAAEWRLAADAAERLGAAPLLGALRDLGSRARLAAPNGPAPSGAGPFGALTAREREVLKLVAEGRSNREIAGELFISPKTASVHVSNILAKLNVANRAQAAALAHRERL
ncbi:LuxR family transcriptional regulator [Actinomadura sp. WMMB 499]|uniref:helix-turn-helix transcriptional regulator n=1 Tax=Actinomadura sp. WMMB 499 TaxID=1219491 RepID=UPI00124415B7|nr:LuxR family transcriptional regulator [Actinomadura sp. WMMB 499]QFG20525.1 AAA family ATPase [Actinomadura sp. WMMB 499]